MQTIYRITIVIVVIGFALHFALKRVDEAPIRTTLPLQAKLPILIAVSTLLVLIKNGLQGFAGFFPLVSVIAAYETRTTLWTLAKPAPIPRGYGAASRNLVLDEELKVEEWRCVASLPPRSPGVTPANRSAPATEARKGVREHGDKVTG